MTAPVNTENTAYAFAVESSLGTLPGSPTWYTVEPNGAPTWGATYSKVARDPITKDRQQRKGDIVDVDSAVGFDLDMTMSHMRYFIEGFCFASFAGEVERASTAVDGSTETYTIANGTSLAANTLIYARGFNTAANNGLKRVASSSATTAVVVENLTTEASPPSNAVVTVCGVQAAPGDITMNSSGNLVSTALDFTTLSLTAGQFIKPGGANSANQFKNTANNNFARIVSVAANLITLDKRGDTFVTDDGRGDLGKVWQVDDTVFVDETTDANSATDADYTVFPASEDTSDYAAFGLDSKFIGLVFDNANGTAGVGGTVTWEYWNGTAWASLAGVSDGTTGFTAAAADGQQVTWTEPQDWATTSLNSETALYYVRAKVSGAYSTNPVYDQVQVLKSIHIYFGNFCRNVGVDHAKYLNQSFQFEAAWEGLGDAAADEYEYAKGNRCNSMTLNLGLADKATVSFGFIGTDTEPPSTTRATNAATPVSPNRTSAFNTVDEVARLRITQTDETGAQTDFQSLSLRLNNNVGAVKVIGTLGGKYVTVGKLMVGFDAELLFADNAPITAIRNNTTMTMETILRDAEDGAIALDIPSLTLDDGGRDLPRNEPVRIRLRGEAHIDPTLSTSIGVSLFPYVPDGN